MTKEDFSNPFGVSAMMAGDIVIRDAGALRPMTPETAVLLAAWLVAVAEHRSKYTFQYLLERLESA